MANGSVTGPQRSPGKWEHRLREVRTSFRGAIRASASIGPTTVFEVGGRADVVFVPADEEDVSVLLPWLRGQGIATRYVRRGANLLVADGGFRGAMLDLRRACGKISYRVENERHCLVRAGAGVRMGELVDFCVRNGIAGMEGHAGVAGSLGGALVQKRGELWGPLRETLSELKIQRGNQRDLLPREQALPLLGGEDWRGGMILAATFLLRRADVAGLLGARRAALLRRLSQAGGNIPRAGTMFYDEPDVTAAELLRRAGCAELRQGNAVVISSYPNVVGQRPRATSDDIAGVIRTAREMVHSRTGRLLALRVDMAGFDGPSSPEVA
jgi:UDP-N-acetylmuramate dehydrogenase